MYIREEQFYLFSYIRTILFLLGMITVNSHNLHQYLSSFLSFSNEDNLAEKFLRANFWLVNFGSPCSNQLNNT